MSTLVLISALAATPGAFAQDDLPHDYTNPAFRQFALDEDLNCGLYGGLGIAETIGTAQVDVALLDPKTKWGEKVAWNRFVGKEGCKYGFNSSLQVIKAYVHPTQANNSNGSSGSSAGSMTKY